MWLDTGNFSSTLSLLRLEEIEDYLYKTDINSQHLEVAGGGGTPARTHPVRSWPGVRDVDGGGKTDCEIVNHNWIIFSLDTLGLQHKARWAL